MQSFSDWSDVPDERRNSGRLLGFGFLLDHDTTLHAHWYNEWHLVGAKNNYECVSMKYIKSSGTALIALLRITNFIIFT